MNQENKSRGGRSRSSTYERGGRTRGSRGSRGTRGTRGRGARGRGNPRFKSKGGIFDRIARKTESGQEQQESTPYLKKERSQNYRDRGRKSTYRGRGGTMRVKEFTKPAKDYINKSGFKAKSFNLNSVNGTNLKPKYTPRPKPVRATSNTANPVEDSLIRAPVL